MTKREANQQQSLNLFLARKAEFDRMVAELQQMSDDHFGADPEAVLWCEAADLERRNQLLREITDAYFRRGEFAAGRAAPHALPRPGAPGGARAGSRRPMVGSRCQESRR